MLVSTRPLLNMRAAFLSVSTEQWLLLALGLLLGGAAWVFISRRLVGRAIRRLNERSIGSHANAVLEGFIGGVIFLVNAGLVYLATLMASFFLFAFSVAGLLVGAWITIPASFD